MGGTYLWLLAFCFNSDIIMSLVKFNKVGRTGIILDLPAHELPPEAWSAGNNVRFSGNRVMKISGHQQVFNPPSIVPYALFPVPVSTTLYWMYLGLTDAYVVQGSTHTIVTRAASVYSTGAVIPWTGGIGGTVAVFNNGIDVPQMWLPAGAGNRLLDLTAWPAGYTCRVLRPYGNYWVAYDITKAGIRYPQLTLWSHQADPGTVPDSWDVTDDTKDAGESPKLADTPGFIMDSLPLGNTNVIYKEDATFRMDLIGGTFIFDMSKDFEQVGILTHRCVAAMPKGDSHFLAANDDLIVHNLNQVRSVGENRIKAQLYNEIDLDNLTQAHVVPNYPKGEMWFFYPTLNAPAFCDKVAIWNYVHDTLTLRDAPGIIHSNFGRVDVTLDETYDASTAAYDSATYIYDERAYQGLKRNILMADAVNTKLLLADSTNQFNGTNMTAYVERTDLAVAGTDREGNPKVDFERMKLFKRVWVRATGSPFSVYVGTQQIKGGSVEWAAAQTFTPGTDSFVDCFMSGRSLALKFESTSDVDWTLEGYDVEVELLGGY